jgi:AmmeMemoRadiSam system protein B
LVLLNSQGISFLTQKPQLRSVEFQPVLYEGQQMWLLRDPLELTDYQLILPPALAQILAYCDGTLEPKEIQAAVSTQLGIQVELGIVQETLRQLDEACLLENDGSKEARSTLLKTYREQPYRHPALAGLSYPSDPVDLSKLFADHAEHDTLNGWLPWYGRGIISPHIDYHRGGPVYAQVWRRAEAAVKEAELVLIFGTDHMGSNGSITLTQKSYATPFGVLPTDPDLVRELASAIGPNAFAEELHHRKEHSIELSAVWLHYIRGQDPCPMVPILCGSFHEYVMNGHHPTNDPALSAFVETLRVATAGKRVLAVASVDLAHVGPSFGDTFSMDELQRSALAASDSSLIEAISQGDAARFFDEIAQVKDRNRICGFSSIYLMLQFLGQVQGVEIAYEHCPADAEDKSLVSICGLLLD